MMCDTTGIVPRRRARPRTTGRAGAALPGFIPTTFQPHREGGLAQETTR